ncbi:MAG: GNAT family N-acetyltransferase [Muribaculaceae bacterium]|nr:GNAT family N-acetyltransferase [Muribaculaceae bacterium]
MENMEYEIVAARKEDAAFLARTVMEAVGEELCVNLAGGVENLPKVKALFRRVAEADDSQYSYRNALIAKTPGGEPIGAIIFYDGALLHPLRRTFFSAANEILGWAVSADEVEAWDDETGPDQVYLDSLFVEPKYRGRGVATALFKRVFETQKRVGKPFGLLVEPGNTNAMRLYERLGFKQQGVSNFFNAPMLKMQRPNVDC